MCTHIMLQEMQIITGLTVDTFSVGLFYFKEDHFSYHTMLKCKKAKKESNMEKKCTSLFGPMQVFNEKCKGFCHSAFIGANI